MLKKYNDKFWDKVLEDSMYQNCRETIKDLYHKYCDKPPRRLSYANYKLFQITGDRRRYEEEVFLQRKQLAFSAVMYLIYKKQEYLDYLQEVIWAICDQYSWSVPAHIHAQDMEGKITTIDLFASEMGHSLSELCYILEDKLDTEVKDRMYYEVNRRIIQKFMTTESFWWENAKSNWASVCACQVAATFLYLAPNLFEKVRPRFEKAMESFLSSFGNDGACLEGIAYWNYGFGLFVMYQELLSSIDKNALRVFENPKVKNAAMFYQKACLKDGIAVTFSDSQPQALYDIGLLYYLKEIYGDEIKIPPEKFALPLERTTRVSSLIRAIMYYDPSKNEKDLVVGSYYFEDAQWYIKQNERYSFAAKGGHNAEPHNHNDIGSFMVCVNGKQILCDIGVGVYNKDYFAKETRYKFLGNSSLGHSVPIINGKEQMEGVEYKASFAKYEEEKFSVEILGAYDEKGSLVRIFHTYDDRIVIIDSYHLDNHPTAIIERFISYQRPELRENSLVWDGLTLEFDGSLFEIRINQCKYENNFLGIFDVYLVDLSVKEPSKEMELIFNIQFH